MTAYVMTGVLFGLAAWHAYWVFGGRRGARVVVPHTVEATPTFRPSRPLTFLVGMALATAGLAALNAGPDTGAGPTRTPNGALYVLAMVFLLRTVGDFRYVGLFKQVKCSSFARWDTRLFTPLCLALAVGFILLARQA